MSALTQNPFQDLYDYSTSEGIVIPQTSDVKSMVEDALTTVFGASISTDETTPMGRFVEALTMLIVNVLGVNAQNANFTNPKYAVGNALDNVGAIFGILRGDGMGDEEYRKLILQGQSNGTGFAESIVRSVLAVSGVKSVVVLNNGMADPAMEPQNEAWSVQVEPHSVMVSVRGGDDALVAKAIADSISLGCGMVCEDSKAGTATNETIENQTITFYRPSNEVTIAIQAGISPDGYSGSDIEATATEVIKAYLAESNHPGTITPAKIQEYVNNSGNGIICNSATIAVNDSIVQSLTLYPRDFIDPDNATIGITV